MYVCVYIYLYIHIYQWWSVICILYYLNIHTCMHMNGIIIVILVIIEHNCMPRCFIQLGCPWTQDVLAIVCACMFTGHLPTRRAVCVCVCVVLSRFSRDLWDPFIANNQCSCPCWWYFFIHTSKMRPGPDLLQTVPTLVLNVDFLMIMRVKGPVGSIYCKQPMFLSLLMIFFHTE